MSGNRLPSHESALVPAGPRHLDLSGGEGEAGGASLMAALLRHWRMLFLVTLSTAIIALAAIWNLITPKFEVLASVHVAPTVRPILFSDQDTDISRFYREYMNTEASTLTSPAVIAAALDSPELRALPTVRGNANPIQTIRKRIRVEQEPGTQLLTVYMIGEAPQEMAAIVNGVIQSYLRRNHELQRERDERILRSLRTEETELEKKLEFKWQQLRQAAVDQGLVGAEPAGSLLDKWTTSLQEQLTENVKRRAIATRKLESMVEAEKSAGDSDDMVMANPAELENFLAGNAELHALKEQLRTLELSSLTDTYLGRGPSHPEVRSRPDLIVAVSERIATKENLLTVAFVAAEKSRLEAEVRDAEITHRVLQEELRRISDERSGTATQLFQLENLKHERDRLVHSLHRVREKIWTVEVEQNRAPRSTQETIAQAPIEPNIDKRMKYSLAALAFCGFLGLGAALIRSRFDTIFRDPTEVVDRLGIRLLGSVQFVEDVNPAQDTMDGRLIEPIRGISAALLAGSNSNGNAGKTHIRLITSPTPGSGKSTLALNLARSLALTGRKVLLIDGDNNGQSVTRRSRLANRPGLLHLLEGTAGPADVTQASSMKNLRIVPSGKRDDRFGDLLGDREAQERLRSLFNGYDEVIVDSPPVLVKADALALSTLVDEVVFVLRAGRSTREEAYAAQQYLASVGANVVGVILNAVDPRNARYGYGYSYAYAGGYPEEES